MTSTAEPPASMGARIRQRRLRKKFSQAELARQAGITAGALWRIELGTGKRARGAGRDLLIKLAVILDVSLDYLLLGTNPPADLDAGSDADGSQGAA